LEWRAGGEDGYAMDRRLALLILLVAVALSTGCGTGQDQREARAATERFSAALQRGDGATACAQLSPALRRQVVSDEPGSRCAKAILQVTVHGRRASATRVYATEAQVDLAGGDTFFLGDTREGWRLDAIGCRPQGGGPYDCEEQS
jgi:hypothetical protein